MDKPKLDLDPVEALVIKKALEDAKQRYSKAARSAQNVPNVDSIIESMEFFAEHCEAVLRRIP